ncbi:Mth938-like domain-containing protein [Kingella kingae]|uniref:Rod shape-determining protein RodA n=2 Tax=Kingella kingae TaxID=504 RepID=F5S7H8_KINKI|nr:Mth938-like domain-containing protein [Kingella kingae]EGK08960.1 hypothetical protein HMPREF0476_1161 [Kingella kingae ATCC 23330]EIC13662.1 hypothetical protein KKB_04858 [Kingella kingae PYKK081]MBD3614045.1 Mth938-like domain-containing protein [Kingella kingae]MBD3632374.1 Mth938-like domain-containing protein [Kingella kingae]MBD3659767.1 Mth938-like domain-containing protein [Kingella kingae]
MNFEEMRLSTGLTIDAHNSQQIEISGKIYEFPVYLGDEVCPVAYQTEQEITLNDVQAAFEQGANVLLIGTGEKQRFVSPKLVAQAASLGVGLECMTTAAACRTYMLLRSEGRKVCAWLW